MTQCWNALAIGKCDRFHVHARLPSRSVGIRLALVMVIDLTEGNGSQMPSLQILRF